MTSTLVLGSAGSCVARHATSLLRGHDAVTCLVTASPPVPAGIADFRERLGQVPGERPEGWTEVPVTSLAMALLASRRPVLLSSVPDWLWSVVEAEGLWADPRAAARHMEPMLEEAAVALRAVPFDVVLVSNEPAAPTASDDRDTLLLAELLGVANTRLSAACAQVHVVTAGRVLDLSGARPVPAG